MKYSEFKTKIGLPKIDKDLVSRISKFKLAMITKDNTNSDFMTSPYIGLHNIRFTDEDVYNFFFICGMDKDDVMHNINKLEYLKPNWKVATNPFNFICVTLIEEAYNSKLPKKYKEDMIISLGIIYQFKLLTSIYSHYFDYNEDISVVKAAYESLYKYSLHKKLGSNYAVLEHRARLLITNKTHYSKLKKGGIKDIVYIINDMSGALRSTVQSWYKYLNKVKEDNKNIGNVSIVTRGEDGEHMTDINDLHTKYSNTIIDTLISRDDWIDINRIDLILEFAPNISRERIVSILESIREDYLKNNPDEVIDLIHDIVNVNIKYIYLNKRLYPPYMESIALIIKYLKGLWSSSGAKDKRVKKTKTKLIKKITKVAGIKNKQVLTYSSIIISIYIFLLAITENKNK